MGMRGGEGGCVHDLRGVGRGRFETCNAGSVQKRSNKKRRRTFENATEAPSESAGQQLSLEEQERASLRRIMSEMGHRRGHKAVGVRRKTGA
jgi:hypothetical protein